MTMLLNISSMPYQALMSSIPLFLTSSIPLLLTSRRPSPSHVQLFHSPFGDDDCPTASTEQPIQADRPQAMCDYNQHVGCLEARLDRMDVFLQKL